MEREALPATEKAISPDRASRIRLETRARESVFVASRSSARGTDKGKPTTRNCFNRVRNRHTAESDVPSVQLIRSEGWNRTTGSESRGQNAKPRDLDRSTAKRL